MTGYRRDNPYSRVYHSVVDDPKFAEVFTDDRRLATWLRLLLLADSTYPQPTPLPRSASLAAVRHLVEVGLLSMVGKDHYRVCGMARERDGRSARASAASNARWNAERIASGNAEAMLDETRRDKTRRESPPTPRRGADSKRGPTRLGEILTEVASRATS